MYSVITVKGFAVYIYSECHQIGKAYFHYVVTNNTVKVELYLKTLLEIYLTFHVR